MINVNKVIHESLKQTVLQRTFPKCTLFLAIVWCFLTLLLDIQSISQDLFVILHYSKDISYCIMISESGSSLDHYGNTKIVLINLYYIRKIQGTIPWDFQFSSIYASVNLLINFNKPIYGRTGISVCRYNKGT